MKNEKSKSQGNTSEINLHPGNGQRWYVVQTKTRKEVQCRDELDGRGIAVLCPMVKEYRWRRRTYETIPLFPGYIFARFSYPDDYYDIKWAKGVSRLVQFGDALPPSVPESVMDFLQCRLDDQGIFDDTPEFQPGDPVQFRYGPLKGLLGRILRADNEQGRIMVLMDLLYQAKIEVDAGFVTPI